MRVKRPDILRYANGQPCQWCGAQDGTTVAAHSNWSQWGGKSMGRKADDTAIAYLCQMCHFDIDQGSHLTKVARQVIWLTAHHKTMQLLIDAGLITDADAPNYR